MSVSERFWITYRTELVGVTLQGPPPVGRVHLRLSPGVSVLYGLNGAGKSSILKGLKAALEGIADSAVEIAYLHVRISAPSEALYDEGRPEQPSDFPGQLLELLVQEARSRVDKFAMDYGDLDSEMARMRQRANDVYMQILQESSPAEFVKWFREFDLEGPEDEDVRIIEEIAAQGEFILSPIGYSDSRWRVAVAGCITEEAAAFAGWVEQERGALRELQKVVGESDGEVDAERLVEIYKQLGPARLAWEPQGLTDEVRDGGYRPPGFSYPLLWIGELPLGNGEILPPVIDGNLDVDLHTHKMAQAILYEPNKPLPRLVEGVLDDEVALADAARKLIDLLKDLSNRVFRNLLVDAPELRCHVLHPEEWQEGNPFRWEALDAPTQTWVSSKD